MGRGRESFEKRRLEKVRQERKADKADRRKQRRDEPATGPDATVLMERFREISEQYSAGAIDTARYEAARREIFIALGYDDPAEDSTADTAD